MSEQVSETTIVDGVELPTFIDVRDAPPQPSTDVFVSKANALRLLTADELKGLNRARREVAALTLADYESTDPAKEGLVALEGFLSIFDAADQVNLKDAGLAQGMGLLKAIGIIATNERVAAILSNTPPA